MKALEVLGDKAGGVRFTCSGRVGANVDATVADKLCTDYGFSLNPKNLVRPNRVSPEEGYKIWRQQSLGTYYPLVIPATRRHPARVHMNGGGGEVYRDYYARHSSREFFDGHGTRNLHPWLGPEAAELGFDAAMSVAGNRHESPLRANYREFRHRFHVGRVPRQTTSFTPLDSVTAEAANLSDEARARQGAYFNYDVLASLDTNLLRFPFDSPAKSPDSETLIGLVRSSDFADVAPGVAYGKFDSAHEVSPGFTMAARVEPFVDGVNTAIRDEFVRSFCGTKMVESAERIVRDIAAGGSIGNPVNGYPVSCVLSAFEVSPTRNG